jgi:hypothetical protein
VSHSTRKSRRDDLRLLIARFSPPLADLGADGGEFLEVL